MKVFSTQNPDKPLTVKICPYVMEQRPVDWAVDPAGYIPDGDFHNWARQQVNGEVDSFKDAIESFLVSYSDLKCPQMVRLTTVKEPPSFVDLWLMMSAQDTLVASVLNMCAMWRILTAKSFRVEATGISDIPDRVLIHLKTIAQRAMCSAERTVLSRLDSLSPGGMKNRADRPAVWACLWRTILFYRDLLVRIDPSSAPATSGQVAAGGSIMVDGILKVDDSFLETTRMIFDNLIISYSSHFRTTDAQKLLKEVPEDDCDSPFRHETVRAAFIKAKELRGRFCKLLSMMI
jgi:hypothetical protein